MSTSDPDDKTAGTESTKNIPARGGTERTKSWGVLGGLPDQVRVQREELYAAVSDVGSRQRTLNPDVLKRYAPILDAPGVRSRVPLNSSSGDLARAAHEALLEAIATLRRPLRQVAEAALGADTKYADLLVKQRHLVLARELGRTSINRDWWRDNRRRALNEIVTFLMRSAPAVPSSTDLPLNLSPAARGMPEGVVQGFNILAHRVAQLHLAALACMFVSRLDSRLAADAVVIDHREDEVDWPALTGHFFGCFGLYLHGRALFDQSYKPWKEPYLTTRQVATLNYLLNSLEAITPLRPPERADIAKYYAEYRSRRDMKPDPYVANLYEARWLPWLLEALPAHDTVTPTGCDVIAAKSACVITQLAGRVGLDTAPIQLSLVATHGMLVRYYDQLVDDVTLEDKPLPVAVDEYLRSGIHLANTPLVWQGGESGSDVPGPKHILVEIPEVEEIPRPDWLAVDREPNGR
jgi:hypothetical protein